MGVFGAMLRPFWGPWAPFWGLWESLGAILGVLAGVFEASDAILKCLGSVLDVLDAIVSIFGHFHYMLRGSWRFLEALGGSGSCFKAVEALGKS